MSTFTTSILCSVGSSSHSDHTRKRNTRHQNWKRGSKVVAGKWREVYLNNNKRISTNQKIFFHVPYFFPTSSPPFFSCNLVFLYLCGSLKPYQKKKKWRKPEGFVTPKINLGFFSTFVAALWAQDRDLHCGLDCARSCGAAQFGLSLGRMSHLYFGQGLEYGLSLSLCQTSLNNSSIFD